MDKLLDFIKKETVFVIALLFAFISSFFVMPNKEYIKYIDFRVLSILFCLMGIISGYVSIGIFIKISRKLLKYIKNTRQLYFLLVSLCFFFSMLVTNDVSLITFIPFTIMILNITNKKSMMIKTIVFETIAANLGSMITPIGNPQNLYLYSLSKMPIAQFIATILPYWILSFIILTIFILFEKKESISIDNINFSKENDSHTKNIISTKFIVYSILFLLCLGAVLYIFEYYYILLIVIITIFILDKKILKNIDYILLLTFVCFFIFVGNMKNIKAIDIFLRNIITNKELLTSVAFSQFISNVPAAVLLSGFTDKYKELIIGTNLGGLGTIVASLASLISFKFYSKEDNVDKGKYLSVFTIYNIIALVILIIAAIII